MLVYYLHHKLSKVNEVYALCNCFFRGCAPAFAFSDAFDLISDLCFARLALFEPLSCNI